MPSQSTKQSLIHLLDIYKPSKCGTSSSAGQLVTPSSQHGSSGYPVLLSPPELGGGCHVSCLGNAGERPRSHWIWPKNTLWKGLDEGSCKHLKIIFCEEIHSWLGRGEGKPSHWFSFQFCFLDKMRLRIWIREIQGTAKLWITSRPAAASKFPAEIFDMVTEI